MVLFGQSPAHADMYQYVDKNGQVHITDNPGGIPGDAVIEKHVQVTDSHRAPSPKASEPKSSPALNTEAYLRKLQSTNTWERKNAIEMLGREKDPRAVAPLIKVIESALSPLDNVVFNTEEELVKALSGMGEPAIDFDLVKASGRALIEIGIPDPSPYANILRSRNIFVRWSILGIIRNAKTEHASELYAIAMKDASAPVRAMTATCLDGVQDAQGMALLIQALKDESDLVRKEARRTFENVRLLDIQALTPVAAAVTDNDIEVRRAVVEFLSKANNPAAVKPLIRALGDKDKDVRLRAATALGPLKDPAAVDGLIAALGDANADIRRSAAGSLGMIKDPRSISALIVALKDPVSNVRDVAREALIKIGQPAADKLIAALRTPDQNTRQGAAYVLGRMKDPKAVPALIAVLKDTVYDVKGEAIDALGAIPDPRAVDALMEATKYEGYIQSTAIALGNQKDKRAVDLLIKIFQTKRYPWTAWALGEIGDRKAVPPIMECYRNAQPYSKGELLEALGKLGGPGVLDLLVNAMNDPNRDVQASAAKALKLLKDPRSVPALIAAMQKNVALDTVVEALGEIKDPSSVSELIRVMNDGNVHLFTRQRARTALANIGAPSVKPLIAVMQDKTSRSRDLAIEALGTIRDQRAVEPLIAAACETAMPGTGLLGMIFASLEKIGPPSVDPLIALLSTKDERMQLFTIGTLGRLKDKRSAEPLLRMLKEGGLAPKTAVVTALGLIGDRRAVEPIIDLLGSQYHDVRFKSAEALGELRDRKALPHLLTTEQDTSEDIRKAAKKAIQQINAAE